MTNFYVYVHTRNDTGEVFYVGKGSGRRRTSTSGRNVHWHNVVKKHDFRSEIIEQFSDEDDAFAMERYLIASYRALGFAICNQTDGGDGVSGKVWSDEERERKRAFMTGTTHRPETIEKMRMVQRTRIRSEDERAKARTRAIERNKQPMSPESRQKISTANTGKKHQPDTIEKIRQKHIGHAVSEETKAKIKATRVSRGCGLGYVASNETRAKLAAAQTGRVKSEEELSKIKLARSKQVMRKGYTLSDESKAKMSKAAKDRPLTTERLDILKRMREVKIANSTARRTTRKG